MKLNGNGKRNILICGEGPGFNEDQQGKPFVGASGQLLQSTLAKFDVDLREDCFIYNSIICHSTNSEGKNRTPTDAEIGYCRPNVIRTIKELQPNVIILLGGSAVKSVIGWLWKDDVGLISRWDGWRIPCQSINAWITPTWHPAALLHNDYGKYEGKNDRSENEVRKLLFEKHLKAACKLDRKPWKKVPDYRKQVKVIIDIEQAAKEINAITSQNMPTAFDIECTGLKPERDEQQIVSCSMSNGKMTISYPWHGSAIEATKRFLLSNVPKIGFNIKYEIRFILKKLGIMVNNWKWCGMTAAHILDSRPNICGLKFQSFVLLGQDSYDDQIKPYLKAENSNGINRIGEVNLNDLLVYGGIDSLLEWKVAKIQSRRLGIDLFR